MRILLTAHGAPHDEQALRFGAQVALHADEPPTILTVIDGEANRPRAEAILGNACQILNEIPNVQTKIRIGPAAREIIREAAEGTYDLVIVGERKNPNLFARFLTGSTMIRVVEHAPCPVIVAKGRTRSTQRILLCDSGAEGPLADQVPVSNAVQSGSSLLARFTVQLADLIKGEEEITVLHVMSQISAGPGVEGKQLRASAEELIEERAPEGRLLMQDIQVLGQPGIRVYPKVRRGLVVDEILEEAHSGDYDVVVIGAHRGEGWQRILLDDIAHRIVTQLDRTVIVVR